MKRNLTLICLFVLFLGLSTGCGLSRAAAEIQPTPVPVTSTPAGSPVIKIGVNAQYAPFAFMDGKGHVVGFDLELMTAIAKAGGFQVEYVDSAWGVLFKALDKGDFGNFDAIIAAITITPEKQQRVNFSQPYFNAGQAMVVKKGGSIQQPAQLKGQKVGVLENTTSQQWVTQNITAEVRPFSNLDEAFTALAQGKVAVVINDGPSSAYFIKNNPQLDLVLVGQSLTEESYGIAVRQDKPDLLAAINSGLNTVIASGEYAKLCTRWLGETESCLPATAPVPTNTPAASPLAPTTETAVPSPAAVTADQSKSILPLLSCRPAVTPASQSGRSYQIQAGDWLSSLAKREYGNPLDYRAILVYTNQFCQADPNLHCLNNPDQIEVGWKIYLPSPEEVAAYWQGQLVTLPPLNLKVGGDMAITGSSTVYPLTRQLAVCFQEEGFTGHINLDSTGTLAGFKALCEGQTDIANASHVMRPEDKQLCQNNNRQPLELQVGTDALAIVVSHQNDFVTDVSQAELRQILSTAATWSEVRAEWPAQPIKRFFPTEQSGTFLFMTEKIFENKPEALLKAANTITSEDDEQLVKGIQSDPLAVGFLGYAYYERDADMLRALPVNGINPLPETVDQGSYPLVRPLYLYSTTEIMKQKPQVSAFLNYYLQSVRNYVIEVGYFLPGETAFQEAVQNFNRAGQP